MLSLGKSVSIRPMPLRLPSPQRFISKCATNDHNSTTNPTYPTSTVTPNNNFAFGGISKSRTDLQSSCVIFASTLAESQPNTKEASNVDNINTSDHSKPLTFNETCPSPTHGSDIRVAYQGVPGAYSEAAACKSFPNCEAVPCEQFEVAFQAVELWTVDRAVLPIENSVGGSVHRNYDLLLRHRLHIVGEVQLPIHHCLLALPGVAKEDLNRVISHPQALAQCETTVTALGLNLTRESFYNTAGAAEFIAKNNLRDTAAIASERAAKLYGLNILEDGIHDAKNNLTRFMILARQPNIPCMGRPFRTSIVFAHDNATSVLFKVLSAFAFRNIKLTKIESRPHGIAPATDVGTVKHFEYMFYVDFEASMADVRAQNALAYVQEFTSFLRVLGSYPIDTTI